MFVARRMPATYFDPAEGLGRGDAAGFCMTGCPGLAAALVSNPAGAAAGLPFPGPCCRVLDRADLLGTGLAPVPGELIAGAAPFFPSPGSPALAAGGGTSFNSAFRTSAAGLNFTTYLGGITTGLPGAFGFRPILDPCTRGSKTPNFRNSTLSPRETASVIRTKTP